jgi:hypothetical protein
VQPLLVELWQRSEQSHDACLGIAAIPMLALADAASATTSTSRRQIELVAAVVSPLADAQSPAVGEVRVTVTMDDLGLLESDNAPTSQMEGRAQQAANAVGGGDSGSETDGGGQDAMEYEVAWQLEMWKRNEEARWEAELRKREALRMDELEAAWRAKEIEREVG